jgi:hypothetical protein
MNLSLMGTRMAHSLHPAGHVAAGAAAATITSVGAPYAWGTNVTDGRWTMSESVATVIAGVGTLITAGAASDAESLPGVRFAAGAAVGVLLLTPLLQHRVLPNDY